MAGHRVDFEVTKRQPGGKATEWGAWCSCSRARSDGFYGPTYDSVEDDWRRHVYELTGTAPAPFGNKTGRWMP
jgi:hypothetical protein